MVDDLIPYDLFGDGIEDRINILPRIREILREVFGYFRVDLCGARLPLFAIERIERPRNLLRRIFAHQRNEFRIRLVDIHFHLGFAHFSGNPFNKGDDFLDRLMCKQDRFEHFSFRQLVCASFHHHHRIARPGYR